MVYPQRIRRVRASHCQGVRFPTVPASRPSHGSGQTSLLDAFVSRPPDMCCLTEDSMYDWLAFAQEEWRAGIPWDRIPWHGEAKARAGAFATLLGLTVAAKVG